MEAPGVQLPDTTKLMTIGYLAAILLVLFFVYKILKGFGIVKSAAKEKEKAKVQEAVTDLRAVKQFNALYLENKRDYKSLSTAAQLYAETLRKAFRGLGTDEEAIYSTFSRLPNKDSISEVALVYRNKYNRDLLTDLLNDLTDKEKAKLMDIINRLS